MFSEDQLERLRSYPDIGRDDLIRYFTLTPADVAFIDPGRGPTDRLGLAVQLATLPCLGFVPDEVGSAPPVAVARLAERGGRSGRSRRVRSARADTLRSSAVGGRLSGLEERSGREHGDEGTGAVPAGPGHGTRLARPPNI
nr:DUF4158 domain-containing protein [Nonomuraea pusilla]